MKSREELLKTLESIDHKGYPAYKSLAGSYQFSGYILGIDHVQGDPFASPSAVLMEIPMDRTGIPKEYYQNQTAAIALQDYLLREFAHAISRYRFQEKGSGKSGLIAVSRCTQEVLERSACERRKERNDIK